MCLLWSKINNSGTQATSELCDLHSEDTEWKKNNPPLKEKNRHGDHMIERGSKLLGGVLIMLGIARRHTSVTKENWRNFYLDTCSVFNLTGHYRTLLRQI